MSLLIFWYFIHSSVIAGRKVLNEYLVLATLGATGGIAYGATKLMSGGKKVEEPKSLATKAKSALGVGARSVCMSNLHIQPRLVVKLLAWRIQSLTFPFVTYSEEETLCVYPFSSEISLPCPVFVAPS